MKQRADLALVSQGLADSRQKAQALILSGRVYLAEVRVDKASFPVPEGMELMLRGEDQPWASRGGYKLEKAIKVFGTQAEGRICMDVGAAAGGFTDVLLRAGARHVYAIDVGYGQLDWRLRQDKRVTVMERTNARSLSGEQLSLKPTLAVMDVSFISIQLILPALFSILEKQGEVLSLVKPQFEAGRGLVGKHGVVREKSTHIQVLVSLRDFCHANGWSACGMDYSPIKGPKGNIEFLAHIVPGNGQQIDDQKIRSVVETAHNELSKSSEE